MWKRITCAVTSKNRNITFIFFSKKIPTMEQSQVDDPKGFHKPLSQKVCKYLHKNKNNLSPKINTTPYRNCRNKSTCCYSVRAILATCSHPSMAFSWMNSCVPQKKRDCCTTFLFFPPTPNQVFLCILLACTPYFPVW